MRVGASERERKKGVREGIWVCQKEKERRGGDVKGVIILATIQEVYFISLIPPMWFT